VLPREEGLQALESVLKECGCTSVSTGEMDFLHASTWQFGFIHETSFSVFGNRGPLAHLHLVNGESTLMIGDRDGNPVRNIPVKNIKNVLIRLSPEPWDERKLLVRLHGEAKEEVEILKDYLHDFEAVHKSATGREQRDALTMLSCSTEWLVKTAGYLAVNINRMGGQTQLLLPQVLMPAKNAHVKQRQDRWMQWLRSQQNQQQQQQGEKEDAGGIAGGRSALPKRRER
jgi:hypothetical protein